MLSIFDATMIAEGQFEQAGYFPATRHDDEIEELSIEAWQRLIDTGVCWQLQGSFGRQAAALIDAGICTAPEEL